MRTAKPKRLHSGRWGAWVTGGGVEPDMLICVRTRSGTSWYSKVKNVQWEGPWGAICERIDIAEEDDLNLEIPFLDQLRPDSESNRFLLGRLRDRVYDWVEDANGPAPEIEHYEYYEHYEIDCDLYEFRAQRTIEELEREIKTRLRAKSNQRTEATLNSQKGTDSDQGAFAVGENRIIGEGQRGVRKAAPRKRAKLCSSQPILDPSYLPKPEHSGGYSRLGGRNSAWS